MTYNVFGGTLSLTQSINHYTGEISAADYQGTGNVGAGVNTQTHTNWPVILLAHPAELKTNRDA